MANEDLRQVRALVTGASGLIGSRLARALVQPRVLVRDVERARRAGAADALSWDTSRAVPAGALAEIEAVFHLAGAPIAGGRLTEARKREVRETRVQGTRRVVEAIASARAVGAAPAVLICASAVGFYGSRGEEQLTEASAQGAGYLAEVCAEWEAEAHAASALGVRVVTARIGIVLAREGGSLAVMRPAFRLGVGATLGTGEQWMPWIHVDDVVGLLLHAALQPALSGALNVCAPNPERNRDFTASFARALHRPAFLRVPAPVLRLVAGELADVMTASQRVLPVVAEESGYAFRFASLQSALTDLG